MEEDGLVFRDIFLATRCKTKIGQLNVHPKGIHWKEHGDGESVDLNLHEISGLTWMESVFHLFKMQKEDGTAYTFVGFQEEDFTTLNDFFQCHVEMTLEKTDPPVMKQNYVEVVSNENILTFQGFPELAFQVSLADVESTLPANKPDTLMQDGWLTMTTYHTHFPGGYSASQISEGKTMLVVNESCSAKSSVAIFKKVTVIFGEQHNVELDRLSIRFYDDDEKESFDIAYEQIGRLFCLPMVTEDGVFSIIVANLMQSVKYPYRQRSYPHLIMQFQNDVEAEVYLKRIEDVLGADQIDKLEALCKGPSHEAFISIICTLADKEISGPGSCCNSQGGYGVECSLLKDQTSRFGVLFPLETDFVFLLQDPTFIAHEQIEYVEFRRCGVKGARLYYATFDLAIKMRNGIEHVFSKIRMAEYGILLRFISMKGLKIRNRVDPGRIIYVSTAASEAGGERHDKAEHSDQCIGGVLP